MRHEKSQRQFERLAALSVQLQREGLRGEEAMAYAALVKRYGTPEDALEAYRAIFRHNPNDARIAFGVGKYLLDCREPEGVGVLEHAMALDKRYVAPACRLISVFTAGQRASVPQQPAAEGRA